MYIGVVSKIMDGISGINSNYMQWASDFGTAIHIPPVTKEEFYDFFGFKLDAIILPGGADIDSRRYKQKPWYYTGNPDTSLEWFDEHILPDIIGSIPIFGICRGLQTLNVLMGGTLTQHLAFHPYSESTYDLVHNICTPAGKPIQKTNSFHHQSINVLGKGLKIVAESGKGLLKVIEAISYDEKRIRAVQYHPERMDDIWTKEFFAEILVKGE